jgi:tyrosinase
MVASAAGPVAMGPSPVNVALNAPQAVGVAPGGAPSERAAPPKVAARPTAPPTAAAPQPAAPTHIYLVIRNLQAHAQPGVLYNVYLDVGSGAAKKSSRLGTINFFDAGHMAGMMSQKFVSFDVTGLVDGNVTMKEIGVTIAPVGEPATDAKPVIGDITLASG